MCIVSSQAAIASLMQWYASSKYGDEERADPAFKGMPFKRPQGGGNDRSVVIRDDLPGWERWKFFATSGVKKIEPRSRKEEEEAQRERMARMGRKVGARAQAAGASAMLHEESEGSTSSASDE